MTHENQFTPRAEEALRLAQEAAEEMGHGYVGCEHLLLGLMREEDGIAHRVLQEYGLTDDMICTVLRAQRGQGSVRCSTLPGADSPGQECRGAGRVRGHRAWAPGYIGTEHLLMGLLREGNNMAIRVLRHRGHRPQEDVQLRGAEDQRGAPCRRKRQYARVPSGGEQEGQDPG